MSLQQPLLAEQKEKNRGKLETSNENSVFFDDASFTVDASTSNVKIKEISDVSKSNALHQKSILLKNQPSYINCSKVKSSQSLTACPKGRGEFLLRKKPSFKEPLDVSLRFALSSRKGNNAKQTKEQNIGAKRDLLFFGGRGHLALQSLPSRKDKKAEYRSLSLKTNQLHRKILPCFGENEPKGAGENVVSHANTMSSDIDEIALAVVCPPTSNLNSKEKATKTNKQQSLPEGKKDQKSPQKTLRSDASVESNGEKERFLDCPASISCALAETPEELSIVRTSSGLNEIDKEKTCSSCEFEQQPSKQQEEAEKRQPQCCATMSATANCKAFGQTANAIYNHLDCYHSSKHYSFTPEVNLLLCQLVEDNILASLIHNVENMMPYRQAELRSVAECLSQVINHVAAAKGISFNALRYYVFGSVAMCTVLPDGDNDMTIEIDGLCSVQQSNGKGDGSADTGVSFLANKSIDSGNSDDISASQAAVVAAGELFSGVADYLRENDTQLYVEALVVAEVRVLKLVKNGSCFDITLGQLGGVDCARFLHELDLEIGCNHLLKRTLLLLRAWCCYEAHVLSGQGGYMSSYTATIMLIAMINTVEFLEDVEQEEDDDNKSEQECHQVKEFKNLSPFQLFARFLKFFSYFDFEHYCVTVFGPLPCSSITDKNLDLSCLEVPAAHDIVSVGKDTCLAKNVACNCFEQSFDVNFLGLTVEGQAAIGDRIRRRAKPFVTVSGVKHLLHDEQLRRQGGSTGNVGVSCKREGPLFGQNAAGFNTPNTGRLQLNRSGSATEDSLLLCSSCNTSNYPLRIMNVMDPLRWSASLSRGVCRNHLQRIRRAFREGIKLFGMVSTRLLKENFLSSVSDAGSDACIVGSETAWNTVGSNSDTTSGHVDQFDSFTLTKKGILEEIYGQTLRTIAKHRRDFKCVPLPLQHAQCKQCKEPSFFCVSNLKQVSEPQYIFEVVKDAQGNREEKFVDCSGVCGYIFNSNNNNNTQTVSLPTEISHQQTQYTTYFQRPFQEQQQLGVFSGLVPLMSPIMLSATAYADPLNFGEFLRLGCWHGVSSHQHGDVSTSAMGVTPQFARGAPLLRTNASRPGVARNKQAHFAAQPASRQPPPFSEHGGFPCHRGCSGGGVGPVCFAPPSSAAGGGYRAKGMAQSRPAARDVGA